ncbi:MAG TPA: hypothetical protein VIO80_13505 [Candidatus Dormibacteraeota bacterium]
MVAALTFRRVDCMPVCRPYSLAQTASTGAVVIIAVVFGLVVFMRKRGG